MDFKAQIASDMKVFHNCGEMATMTDIWYQGKQYYIPIIIDHTAADERQKVATMQRVYIALHVWSIYHNMTLVLFHGKTVKLKLTKPGR